MEKRILVTGFGPFGQETCNPSIEAVRALPGRAGGVLILKEQLPVMFGLGAERLLTLIEEKRPDAVLCTGLAAGRRALTPEVIAVNMKNARIPDNKGLQPLWEKIREEGPAGLFTRMDARKTVQALQEAGIPAEASFSAGTFVCNEVMYRLLETDLPGGFVHVPCAAELPHKKENFALPLKEITKGLEICILELAEGLSRETGR